MPLLPVRVLPVNDAHGGPFLIRVDMDERAADIYVRRESDKKTWSCTVSSIQEILAPSQQARALDLFAVVTCLYHGVTHDVSALHGTSLQLVRREVAFTQPTTWTGDSHRLTVRVAVRTTTTTATATATATMPPLDALSITADVAAPERVAIAVVEPADEDIIFGFNFQVCLDGTNIERMPADLSVSERRAVQFRLVGVAFPLQFLNWFPSPVPSLAVSVRDGVYVRVYTNVEITLNIVHLQGSVHAVLSVGVAAKQPKTTMTYQSSPTSNLYHTVLQYSVSVANSKCIVQVALLHGSMSALEGTSLSIRDQAGSSEKTKL